MNRLQWLAAFGMLSVAVPCALAQDARQQPAAEAWSDAEFADIAGMLTGSWLSTTAMGADEPTQVLMSIAPVSLSNFPNALYAELARSDAPDRPYSKSIFQLYRRQGAIRMRTLEIRDPNSDVQNLVIGLWAAPEFMPDLDPSILIGTLDLELTSAEGGWAGETPYPYPTATKGAVEMTSSIRIAPGRIETADRGFDADGNVVWGASEGDRYVFEPTEPPFKVRTDELGATIITLREDDSSPEIKDGDTVAFQYTGWTSKGTLFDTSRRQGKRPLQYQIPFTLIEGWKRGTDGMSMGDWRKFIVPPELGYGGSSAAGGLIPPNATLIFEAELVFVQPAPEESDQ